MPNTTLKGLAVATALSVGAVTLASPAEAGRRNTAGIIAGAAIGLAAAAIITSSQRRDDYYSYGHRPYYYAPPPRRAYYPAPPPTYSYAPPPAYVASAPTPWTPAWYDYCFAKFRSFDPASGTYQPYHGPRRLCQ